MTTEAFALFFISATLGNLMAIGQYAYVGRCASMRVIGDYQLSAYLD